MAERRLLRGWGRTAPTAAQVVRPRDADGVADAVRTAGPRGVLARGLGRSYGDAAQNAGGLVLDLTGLDTIGRVGADGTVRCGAGVPLDVLLRHLVRQGRFVPVLPGTGRVTLGGAAAADVHGKNHHRDGSIGRHVVALEIVDGRGERRVLAPADAAYGAVVGGMGLAGVVTAVTLRTPAVESAWLAVDTVRTDDLDATMAALLDADAHRYSVAWVDCLSDGRRTGRGVVTSGDHLPLDGVPQGSDARSIGRDALATVPPLPSPGLVGGRRIAAFNAVYHRHAPRRAEAVPTPAGTFFHPLDAVAEWNRLYGSTGFLQYQFVAPDPRAVLQAIELVRRGRAPVALAVLKRFGPGGPEPMSFPRAGWTLTLDIAARTRDLAATLNQLDQLVHDSGGRVYLAKDARLDPAMVAAMYPGLDRWRSLRAELDPDHVFRSDLARRLAL